MTKQSLAVNLCSRLISSFGSVDDPLTGTQSHVIADSLQEEPRRPQGCVVKFWFEVA